MNTRHRAAFWRSSVTARLRPSAGTTATVALSPLPDGAAPTRALGPSVAVPMPMRLPSAQSAPALSPRAPAHMVATDGAVLIERPELLRLERMATVAMLRQ